MELKLLKALSDKTRFGVIRLLYGRRRGMLVSDLLSALGTEPTLMSHHLSYLKRVGLVEKIRQGKHIRYRLSDGVKIRSGVELDGVKVVWSYDE